MKILYVITGLGQGGAERVVCDLADEMSKQEHQVKIIYFVGKILTRPTCKDIELIKINLNSIVSLPKAYISLSKIIKGYQPHVVHSHMVHANILTRLVKVTTPMNKLISTAHSSNEGGPLRMIAYRMTNHLANLSTNVSNAAVASFESRYAVHRGSMKTIYNGVDFDNFNYDLQAKNEIKNELRLDKKIKLILAVGRFNEAKNYFNLLMAIKSLKDFSSIPFVLIIAGDGELRLKIERLILELELDKEVVLLGRRSDIATLMSACDVFVLSSDYEGLPTVLIEALACQANIVSTDVSGASEILDIYGRIVPIKKPEKLAKAIEASLLIEQKNILGRQYAKDKFDIKIVSDEWVKIYYDK
jgi:glycosyltransferase involved in cell wall biosynthesis